MLGFMYAVGLGVPEDHKKCINNYELAAQLGNPHGLHSLGKIFIII